MCYFAARFFFTRPFCTLLARPEFSEPWIGFIGAIVTGYVFDEIVAGDLQRVSLSYADIFNWAPLKKA